jgi:hypothetical protein
VGVVYANSPAVLRIGSSMPASAATSPAPGPAQLTTASVRTVSPSEVRTPSMRSPVIDIPTAAEWGLTCAPDARAVESSAAMSRVGSTQPSLGKYATRLPIMSAAMSGSSERTSSGSSQRAW